jgi:hypothetical protein
LDAIAPTAQTPNAIFVTDNQNITLDGAWLLKADFVRQGPDLLLTGEDGQQTLLVDYFNAETPPNLQTDFGAVISGDLAS